MRKIIPSKPGTQIRTEPAEETYPVGGPMTNPFGRRPVGWEKGLSDMSSEADRLHPTKGMRKKAHGTA